MKKQKTDCSSSPEPVERNPKYSMKYGRYFDFMEYLGFFFGGVFTQNWIHFITFDGIVQMTSNFQGMYMSGMGGKVSAR